MRRLRLLVNLRTAFRVAVFLAGVTALLLLILSWRAGSIYDYKDSFDGAKLPDVDVIVVLAGGRGRIAAAGDLWYRYYEHETAGGPIDHAPILYVSGMGPSSTWNTFQTQLRSGVSKAMRPSDAMLEVESENTEGNAEYFVKNARLKGWKKMLLMTSSYHMKRSQMIFTRVLQKNGLTMEMKSHTVFLDTYAEEEWFTSIHGMRVTIIEYLKWIYYSAFWDP